MSATGFDVVSWLAGALAPLVPSRYDEPRRGKLCWVSFVGSKTDLTAYASDGHVIALVTVAGDFSHIGKAMLPDLVAHRLARRDWGEVFPWSDPDEDGELTAAPHLVPFDADQALTLKQVLQVMPKSRAPMAAEAYFCGPAVSDLGEVAKRLGVFLRFGGGSDLAGAMRVDSPPRRLADLDTLLWVSFAIMPGRYEE